MNASTIEIICAAYEKGFEPWARATLEEAEARMFYGPTPDEIASAWASALWNARMEAQKREGK